MSRLRSARRATARLAAVAVACIAATVGPGTAPAHADQIRDGEYQLRALDAASAWRYATGAGVTVAVLDSGVDGTHPDLAGQVLPGADFVDGSTDGRHDFVGHGTTVAALIAGRSDKDSGVAGLAPAARILPVRVLDAQNKYDDATTVARGLRWAVDHGARVVNISLGGGGRSGALADALAYAEAHDVVVIACTGNIGVGSGPAQVWYPARQAGVVAVAGLNDAATPVPLDTGGAAPGGGTGGSAASLWAGSLTGPATVLTAPAVNLIGPRPGGYWKVQGTSFAAPLVAATATLIRSRWPAMSAANVINRMIRTARDLGPPGRDDRYGYGEVDPVAALTATVSAVRLNPLEPPPPAVQRLSARPPAAGTGASGPLRVLAGFCLGALGSVLLCLVACLVALAALAAVRRLRPRRG